MIITKKNRTEIYSYLFKEGVVVAKKDTFAKTHPNIPNVTNLEVIRLMKSFTTRKLVKETFSWRHYYWYLTNEGIEYLREQLHLPPQIVPSTLKKTQRTARPTVPAPRGPAGAGTRGPRPTEGKPVAPVDYNPEFQRGAGRGFAGARGGAHGDRQAGGRGYRQ